MQLKLLIIVLLINISFQLSEQEQKFLQISKKINAFTKQNTLSNEVSQMSIFKMFDTQINIQNNTKVTKVQTLYQKQKQKQALFIQSSAGMPAKDGQFFPIIFFANNVYYQIKGQILIDMADRPHLHYSAKNQNLIIAQIKSNYSIQILRLAYSYKKLAIPVQATLQVPRNMQANDYSLFKTVTIAGSKYYMLINDKIKQIHFYNIQGILQHGKTIQLNRNNDENTSQNIQNQQDIKAIKLNTHLIVLDNGKLYNLPLNNKNQGFKYCEQIYQNVYGIKFDQSDFRAFYAITIDHVYKYDTVTCKILQKFSLLQSLCDSTNNLFCTIDFHILKQHIFVQGNRMSYYINGTSNDYQNIKLPFSFRNCENNKQGKLFFNRKTPESYIASYACENKQKIYISNLLMQFEVQYSQGTDFTRFRIPLVIFSLGLIFYVTFKRSNKETVKNEQQQELVNKKMQKQIIQRMYFERQQKKYKQGNSIQEPIKQAKKTQSTVNNTNDKKRSMKKQD